MDSLRPMVRAGQSVYYLILAKAAKCNPEIFKQHRESVTKVLQCMGVRDTFLDRSRLVLWRTFLR